MAILVDDPYQPTAVDERSETPIRLRRGRRIVILMTVIVIGMATFEILNHNLFNGWAAFPLQLFRVVLQLSLVWLIWRGRTWARYLLAGYCGLVLYVNLPFAAHFPEMISKGHFGNAILAVLLLVGHVVVGGMAMFSSAIGALMNYRRDERELAEQTGGSRNG